MTYLAPILILVSLVLACFTAPDGQGVWITPNEVVTVSHAHACAAGAQAEISTSNGQHLCVQETPQQVLKVLGDTK